MFIYLNDITDKNVCSPKCNNGQEYPFTQMF